MTDIEMAKIIIKRLKNRNDIALQNASQEGNAERKRFYIGKAVAIGEVIEDIETVIQFRILIGLRRNENVFLCNY